MVRSCPLCKRNPLTLFEDSRVAAAAAPAAATTAAAAPAAATTAAASSATGAGDMELVQLPQGNAAASPDSRERDSSSAVVDSAYVA